MADAQPAGGQDFIRLADYVAPTLPTEELFRKLLGRVQALLARDEPKPFIADDRLQRATLQMGDEIDAPPACEKLLDDLERCVAGWLADTPRAHSIKPIVMPPCNRVSTVLAWAERHGHQVLSSPARAALLDAPAAPDLRGDGLLVIPQLEDWFLRHRQGLRLVRALLTAMDASPRPIVVGCNSWAWAFLAKSVAADLLLPDPVTFVPFDELRLHGWFAQLAQDGTIQPVHFRRPQNGADVLATDPAGKPQDTYLRILAGRSLGIPWVAWHMWRRSLRSSTDDSVAGDGAAILAADQTPGEQTLWVAALDEFVLPGAHEQSALLVLHALLIHGALSAEHLGLVLPLVGESNIVSVLVRAGFVERSGDLFSCSAAAYPAIRAGLASAGLPMGQV